MRKEYAPEPTDPRTSDTADKGGMNRSHASDRAQSLTAEGWKSAIARKMAGEDVGVLPDAIFHFKQIREEGNQ